MYSPNSVVIDCFQETPEIARDGYAIVAIDVIRATTTAITAVASGRRCFPVPSIQAALLLQREVAGAVLAGEISGKMPDEFDLNNSPAEVSLRRDVHRPLILLSSAGTKLIHAARNSEFVYLACFRNFASLSAYLIEHHSKVALLGAGTRGEFREEDQICCAWIARALVDAGYEPEESRTASIIDRWGVARAEDCLCSKSVDYLRRSGQSNDLEFTLTHVNDLPGVFAMSHGEVIRLSSSTAELALPAVVSQGAF